MTPTTYRLRLARGLVALVIFQVVGMIVMAAVMFGLGFSAGKNGPPWFVGFFPILVSLAFGAWIARLPHVIEVTEAGELVFRAWRRTVTIPLTELRSIEADGANVGFVVFRGARRAVKVLASFDGFHSLLSEIARELPRVEIRGC